mmetsp:Transcript_1773/g.2154  ORF Transcript_1773/g.2154 Transcript_1773/m.2154 type:complete len:307 (+) Transcript_1773:259-1179(+)
MNSWMDGPLKGLFIDRELQNGNERTEMVELIPFDVTLARAGDKPVNPIALTEAVNTWMNVNFEETTTLLRDDVSGYNFDFDRVQLRELYSNEVKSQFKITYEGQSLWKTTLDIPHESHVAAMQLEVMRQRQDLLATLRSRSEHFGLGAALVDVRVDLNRQATETSQLQNTSQGQSLDVIIIIAIAVAVLASVLLLFALIMAWKTGKERKQAYLDGGTPSNTDSPSTVRGALNPPEEIGSGNANGYYPESVISEDISTSLSAYYKTGMAGGYKTNKHKAGVLNDAASVSSMESYGYSLDGYASSIAN